MGGAIGKPIGRVDGQLKVTGTATKLLMPKML
jgi:hypothetical protein